MTNVAPSRSKLDPSRGQVDLGWPQGEAMLGRCWFETWWNYRSPVEVLTIWEMVKLHEITAVPWKKRHPRLLKLCRHYVALIRCSGPRSRHDVSTLRHFWRGGFLWLVESFSNCWVLHFFANPVLWCHVLGSNTVLSFFPSLAWLTTTCRQTTFQRTMAEQQESSDKHWKKYFEFSIVCRSIISTNPILFRFLVVFPNWMILTKITNVCCGLKTFLSLKFDIEVPCVRRMVRRRVRGQVFEHLGVWKNHM